MCVCVHVRIKIGMGKGEEGRRLNGCSKCEERQKERKGSE
jgi:hypothetical protein